MSVDTPVVVLIHGRGLKEGAEHEFTKWRVALERALQNAPDVDASDLDLRMAYYADAFYPEVQGRAGAAVSGEVAEERLDTGMVLEWLMARYHDYQATLYLTQAAAEPLPSPGVRATSSRGVFALPAVHVQPGQLYDPFALDVIKYFGLGFRGLLNRRLEEQLEAVRGRPVLLLSHSFGTIVAYDVLTTGDYAVDTWVTLGCPLGFVEDLQLKVLEWTGDLTQEKWAEIGLTATRLQDAVASARRKTEEFLSAIRDKLQSAAMLRPDRVFRAGAGATTMAGAVYRLSPKHFPTSVDRWFNIFDPLDPIAAAPVLGDPTLADEFLFDGQERVYDVPIRNPQRPDTHSEVGYLQALQTTWLVRDFLLRHQGQR